MDNTIPTDTAARSGTEWEGKPVDHGGETFVETPPPLAKANDTAYRNADSDATGLQGTNTLAGGETTVANTGTSQANIFSAPVQTIRNFFGGGKKELESEAEIVPINQLRTDDAQTSLLYGADETPPNPLDLDGGFFALAGVEDQGGTVRQFFTNPTLRRGDIVDRWPIGEQIKEGDILYRIENAEVDGRVVDAENALESARDELPSALVETRASALEQKGEIEGDLAQIESTIAGGTIEAETIGVEIANAQADIDTINRQIGEKEGQIKAVSNQLKNDGKLSGDVDAYELLQEGAISRERYNDILRETTDSEVELRDLKSDLAELNGDLKQATNTLDGLAKRKTRIEGQAEIFADQKETLTARLDTLQGLETISAEEILDRVRDDQTEGLPTSAIAAANRVIGAERVLQNAEAQQEEYIVRSPINGVVARQIPEGLVFNTLDGSVNLNNSTTTSLGEVAEDPQRVRPSEGNDGATPTVVPLDEEEATISFGGLTESQAEEFITGDSLDGDNGGKRVTFRTGDGQVGQAIVKDVLPVAQGGNYSVRLEDAEFLDGTPLTAAEREPIQVFADAWPELNRPTGSSKTVTLGEPTRESVEPNELPQSEQDFNIKIPVYADAEGNRDPEVIAFVEVNGRTRTDGRQVEVLGDVTGTLLAADGSELSANVPVNISPVAETSLGSNSAGVPRGESGQRFQVSVPFINKNGSIGTSTTTETNFNINGGSSVQGGIPGVGSGTINRGGGFGGSRSDSRMVTRQPDAQQLQLDVDIVPSGVLPRDGDSEAGTVRVYAPSAIKGNVEGGDLDD